MQFPATGGLFRSTKPDVASGFFSNNASHTPASPPCEAHEDRIPIAVSFRHIAPGRAGAQNPKNAVDCSSLVGNGRTTFATIRKQGVENEPFRVRQIPPTQCCLPQKGSLESRLDSSVKNRQHGLVFHTWEIFTTTRWGHYRYQVLCTGVVGRISSSG